MQSETSPPGGSPVGVASVPSGPQSEEERKLAELIVDALNLETAAADIDPEAPLYGDGLGLDSIDVLEMSLAISKAYGVQLRSDDPDNGKIFQSLRSLSAYVQARRTK
jgi:acyl carrier protein